MIDDLLDEIPFNQPGQIALLEAPAEGELIKALRSTSHYLAVKGNRHNSLILEHGWKPKRWRKIPQGVQLYCNMAYEPKDWTDLWGFYDYEDYFTQIAEWLPDGARVIEIGTFHGRSAAHLATMLKEAGKSAEIYTIDYYQQLEFPRDPVPVAKFTRNVRALRHLGLADVVSLVPYDSRSCHYLFANESFDFVFVDADHSEVAVQNDIKYYYPKLKEGGAIAGHDYNNRFPGLQYVVNRFFGESNIKTYDGSVWEYGRVER